MRIAVIGAGAMGSIYGAHLSEHDDVTLIDPSASVVESIEKNGIKLIEGGEEHVFHPSAVRSSAGMPPVDLVILFVKSLYSRAALDENRHLIGDNTVLMTLQNGAGHEALLSEYVPSSRIIIGTTEDNGAVVSPGVVRRGGTGRTNIGGSADAVKKVQEALEKAGFDVIVHENIQRLIWEKLSTNASLSVLTAILQCDMSFIASNEYSWNLCTALIKEIVTVADAMGLGLDENEVTEKVRKNSLSNPGGYTSIYADIKNGRKTEVDTISGAVVREAEKHCIDVPSMKFAVNTIHALESRI